MRLQKVTSALEEGEWMRPGHWRYLRIFKMNCKFSFIATIFNLSFSNSYFVSPWRYRGSWSGYVSDRRICCPYVIYLHLKVTANLCHCLYCSKTTIIRMIWIIWRTIHTPQSVMWTNWRRARIEVWWRRSIYFLFKVFESFVRTFCLVSHICLCKSAVTARNVSPYMGLNSQDPYTHPHCNYRYCHIWSNIYRHWCIPTVAVFMWRDNDMESQFTGAN